MVIRASASEILLSATPAELQLLAQSLAEIRAEAVLRVAADTTAEPTPYDRLLAAFEATPSDGPVRVSVVGDALKVTGSQAFLRKQFASFFRFPVNAVRGAHHHHEWWCGNEYVAADSLPLIITIN
ncbi:MAG TPA: hypothetical protein VMS17_01050 [Gemmataceae bacterium]|nr:hypothetical protein [Gemmataceae bacterium]